MNDTWKRCGHPRTPENTYGVRESNPGGGCRTCHVLYQRRMRQRGASNGYENNPAHRDVAVAVKEGRLANLRKVEVRCADESFRPGCSGRATTYDHRDYTRPLDVEPVCRSCNKVRGAARALVA